jgi:hypothetical protein
MLFASLNPMFSRTPSAASHIHFLHTINTKPPIFMVCTATHASFIVFLVPSIPHISFINDLTHKSELQLKLYLSDPIRFSRGPPAAAGGDPIAPP